MTWRHFATPLGAGRACGLLAVAVSSYPYQTKRSDEPLRTRLVELAREKPRSGYRRLHVLLGRRGEHVDHKRVHRQQQILCSAVGSRSETSPTDSYLETALQPRHSRAADDAHQLLLCVFSSKLRKSATRS